MLGGKIPEMPRAEIDHGGVELGVDFRDKAKVYCAPRHRLVLRVGVKVVERIAHGNRAVQALVDDIDEKLGFAHSPSLFSMASVS